MTESEPRTIATVWELRGYRNVWGNARDGYETGPSYVIDPSYELELDVETANAGTDHEFRWARLTGEQIRDALCDGFNVADVTSFGAGKHLWVQLRDDGYPMGQLQCMSHTSLSPIRVAE